MGFNQIRCSVVLSINFFYRWVGRYPLILGLLVFFFLLYRFLPSVFSFLLSSSPIFVCTAVLLQALVSSGNSNVHKEEKKEEEKDDNSAETPTSVGRRRRDITDKTKFSSFDSTSIDGFGPSLASADDSYAVSECSIASNDGSFEMEDEAERLEDARVQTVEWTEDDEKNLMDLGTSELERNQRLENLIARRKARKLSRLAAEKDLIDFDNNEFFQIPSITTKRNDPPLDLSYNPIDVSELPPIPCSAPPVLLSTRNPFDIPYDPHEEKPNLLGGSFQEEFMVVRPKDVQFSRHESFCLGPSSMGEPKKDISDSKLTLFPITEQITSNGVMGGGSHFFPGGTSGERTDSLVSSAPEAEPLPSSVADLGDQEKFIEQDLPQEDTLISHTSFVPKSVEHESQASNEAVNSNSKDIEQEENREVRMVGISGMDRQITHDMNSESTTTDPGEVYMKPGVPRKYEGLSLSPSKEDDDAEGEKTIYNNKDGGLESLSCHIAEGTDYNQIEEPCYDSSPSAIDKKTIEESLFYVDKGVILTTASSTASDLQVEVSQPGSPPALLDRTFSQTDGDSLVHSEGNIKMELSSGSEVPYDLSSHPNDERNEWSPNQVVKSRGLETTRAGDSGDSDDQAEPHVMLETSVVKQASPPPMDQLPVATSDPNVLLDKKEKADSVACNDLDVLSHEALTHPFKGEVSSGNEVPYGDSSHPVGDENESRSDKVIQSSEIETTKAVHAGYGDDQAAPHVVLETEVVEQVPSDSSWDSVGVEHVSTNTTLSSPPPMDQVLSATSDPNVLVDKKEEADSVACKDSDVLSHEASTHPFKEEVSSGNEVLYGASFHHAGDENELRSNKIMQSSQLETTKAGDTGDSDFKAPPHVLETEVLEQVSSDSLWDSAAVEHVSINTTFSSPPPMEYVPSATSDPNVLLDKKERADSVAYKDSNVLSHEASTHPFKGEVNSGNEVPYSASSHPDGDENELSASKTIPSIELETTKAGLSGEEVSSGSEVPYDASSHPSDERNESRSNHREHETTTRAGHSGDSNDQAALHAVLETAVVESISSETSWDPVVFDHVLINMTLSSFPPPMNQVPSATSDPNVLLDKKDKADSVVCNDSDVLSHEASTHPFKEEVSSVNEVPYGAFSHPGGDENDSRANKIIQSIEVETTKSGLRGGSDDPAAPHTVPEPMVVELVSSQSLPESVAVEKNPTDTFSSLYPSIDQVPPQISEPKIPVDEEKEKLVPLMEDPIVQPPLKGVHEEPQTQFLMEKPPLNGEETQDQSTILVKATEETKIIPSRNEPVLFQDKTEDKEKPNPSEVNEAEPTLHSSLFILGGE